MKKEMLNDSTLKEETRVDWVPHGSSLYMSEVLVNIRIHLI
jgi:hypothetical protein